MSGTMENDDSAPVVVHGFCGRRVRDCTCSDGTGQSNEARIAALESSVADLHRRIPDRGNGRT